MPILALRRIRVVGDVAFVPLTQGREAVVDAADVHLVEGRNWYAKVATNGIYALAHGVGKKSLRMHRVIIDAPDHMMVDHIDGDCLNNRRGNLRLATAAQNALNSRPHRDSQSGYKGVLYHPETKLWRARIYLRGKCYELGLHKTKEEAHAAYCRKAVELHGEFARVA